MRLRYRSSSVQMIIPGKLAYSDLHNVLQFNFLLVHAFGRLGRKCLSAFYAVNYEFHVITLTPFTGGNATALSVGCVYEFYQKKNDRRGGAINVARVWRGQEMVQRVQITHKPLD